MEKVTGIGGLFFRLLIAGSGLQCMAAAACGRFWTALRICY